MATPLAPLPDFRGSHLRTCLHAARPQKQVSEVDLDDDGDWGLNLDGMEGNFLAGRACTRMIRPAEQMPGVLLATTAGPLETARRPLEGVYTSRTVSRRALTGCAATALETLRWPALPESTGDDAGGDTGNMPGPGTANVDNSGGGLAETAFDANDGGAGRKGSIHGGFGANDSADDNAPERKGSVVSLNGFDDDAAAPSGGNNEHGSFSLTDENEYDKQTLPLAAAGVAGFAGEPSWKAQAKAQAAAAREKADKRKSSVMGMETVIRTQGQKRFLRSHQISELDSTDISRKSPYLPRPAASPCLPPGSDGRDGPSVLHAACHCTAPAHVRPFNRLHAVQKAKPAHTPFRQHVRQATRQFAETPLPQATCPPGPRTHLLFPLARGTGD